MKGLMMKQPLVKIKWQFGEIVLFFKKNKIKRGKENLLRGRTRFWLWLDSWALNAVFILNCLIQCPFIKREPLYSNFF